MATFYDNASLVMIPSGYKDDKLYSIKPTDGSGDFTFSRDGAGASPATRVNASGLIEKGRENILLQSNTFDTTWATYDTSVTSGQSGYDGSNDAWLLDITGATGFQTLRQTITNSGAQTFSIYAKAGTLNWIRLTFAGGTGPTIYFDLQNGTLGSVGGGVSKIEDVGNGWYRCSSFFDGSFTELRIYPATDNNNPNQSSGNIYIQDAQLEQGLVATDYIETTTAAVSAGLLGDMPRLDYSGGATCPSLLLEPSRVNINPYSEYFGTFWNGLGTETITSNYGESPEGVQNATRLQATSAGRGGMYASIAVNNGATYTISFYAKSLSGTQKLRIGADNGCSTPQGAETFEIGTEWIRIDKTLTSTQTGWNIFFDNVESGTACTGTYLDIDMLVYGYQVEAGSYPTSYIPTYGDAAPRAADSYYNNNLASLHDTANGFCLMFDYSEVEEGDSAFQDYFSIQQAFNNDTGFRAEAAGASNSEWRLYTDNITTTLGFPMTLSNIASRRKVLVKIESTGIKIFADGALITSQSGSVTIPTLGTLQPSRSTTQPALTGIKQSMGMIFFSPILTDAECIALTTL